MTLPPCTVHGCLTTCARSDLPSHHHLDRGGPWGASRRTCLPRRVCDCLLPTTYLGVRWAAYRDYAPDVPSNLPATHHRTFPHLTAVWTWRTVDRNFHYTALPPGYRVRAMVPHIATGSQPARPHSVPPPPPGYTSIPPCCHSSRPLGLPAAADPRPQVPTLSLHCGRRNWDQALHRTFHRRGRPNTAL